MIKAKVYITLKSSVLDPQGKVVMNTLHTLGHASVSDVRVSKFIEMKFDCDDEQQVIDELEKICDKILANPNTETYYYDLETGL
ncbi:MAG: phosphoribosylformylglycinamidine synthase subunit PurS [Candidatus Zophobacter franzmannii]|jgi:phosphoribosylformylglycinamidine synthase|nr:phosphoribosylformylglycinamidine synthase subunit PurS [Candidatus Zophobacter franzmannii]